MFVIVETFLNNGEPSSAKYRVRPLPGQGFDKCMRVQCSRAMRNSYPLGSKFRIPVDLVEPLHQKPFLREVGSADWKNYLVS
jgi:hypothetical protein